MGRRRRQKVRRRPQRRIPDVYPCPDCGNTAIKVDLHRNNGIAIIRCGSCGLEMTIDEVNPLTEPVDCYGSFIDRYYEQRRAEA